MTARLLLLAAHLRIRARPHRFAISLAALMLIVFVGPGRLEAGPAFSDWPSRTVRIIVPFAQGAADDLAARAYADALSQRWMRPVIIDNLPEASLVGDVPAERQDDHTLLYGPATILTAGPLLADTGPRDPVRNLIPIAPGASAIVVVAVTDTVPVHSLKELVALVRAKPGELAWVAGPSLPHSVLATTIKRHKLQMRHAIYHDITAAQVELAEGQLHVVCHALQTVAAMARARNMRILAVTSPRREPMLPDVPTAAEAGLPELEIEALSGLFGPRTMPPELRDRIAADMRAAAREPGVQMALAASGLRAFDGTLAQFTAAIGRQRIRIQQIMHAVDLKSAMK